MADDATDATKKGYTAPTGRPTRVRDADLRRRRAFGPVAQWITFTIAAVVALIILILVTDGGDYNPFDGSTGAPAGPVEPVVSLA